LIPCDRHDGVAESRSHRGGAIEAAVDDTNVTQAALAQAENDRARRSPGPQDDRIADRIVDRLAEVRGPARHRGIEARDKTFHVGVGRAQLAVLEPERIGGPDRLRQRIGPRQAHHRLLVRHGDVRAHVAAISQVGDELGEAFGRHRLTPILGRDAELAQPIGMDQRRARMLDRPADHAGGFEFHASSIERFHLPRERDGPPSWRASQSGHGET